MFHFSNDNVQLSTVSKPESKLTHWACPGRKQQGRWGSTLLFPYSGDPWKPQFLKIVISFPVLRIDLQALHIQSKPATELSQALLVAIVVVWLFETGSQKVAQAGLHLANPLSQPPQQQGLQACATKALISHNSLCPPPIKMAAGFLISVVSVVEENGEKLGGCSEALGVVLLWL